MKFDESEESSFFRYFLDFVKHCEETSIGIRVVKCVTIRNQKAIQREAKGNKSENK